ncbi:hypothetical protein GOP47_0025632 [Adiantum capillus-veneris]|uniref:Uncharacterized protein n=1 Tax=Adiantum capillus-veneris TaxID=13818 RepID=A0A9D4U1M0_ADICA|nr:hypothetical protein GOP47_0025632 [Adiantum capillus-veneris]
MEKGVYGSITQEIKDCYEMKTIKVLKIEEEEEDTEVSTSTMQDMYKEYWSASFTCSEEENFLTWKSKCFARRGSTSLTKKATVKKALGYVLIGDVRYHKGTDAFLQSILNHEEIQKCLKACHEEDSGHYAAKILQKERS